MPTYKKGEELEELNQSLRQRYKAKDDAIAQLSDLVAITVRLQDREKRTDLIMIKRLRIN
jgi:hypothetical protein